MKILNIIFYLVVIAFIMVWARSFYGSMKAFKEGETYLKEHEYIRAITFYDRSIHWYTPINPFVEKSAQRLWEIGLQAEQEGDIKLALIAFRTIRRGQYAASSLFTPGKKWIKKCSSKIDELLMNKEEKRKRRVDSKSIQDTISKSQNPPPDIFWSVMLEIGFLGWIGSVIGFIISLLNVNSGNLKLTLWIWLCLVPLFFSLWVIGMVFA
ncbi:MAG: hypothetical protein SV375_00580 [Thermodesulfobacteriota bacterium]|nr:hypothetical protein [Thermodesulfobacteriota bacterium]